MISATYDVDGTYIADLVRQEALEDARIVVVIGILCAAAAAPIVAWKCCVFYNG